MEEEPNSRKIRLKRIIVAQYFFCSQFTRKALFLSLASARIILVLASDLSCQVGRS